MSRQVRVDFGAGAPALVLPSIDVQLVRRLIAAQFPQWADLPVTPVPFDGWDNRGFRLGNEMAVRLPSAEGYAAQVDKEYRWLPVLAPQLTLPVPVPLARGTPGEGYPFDWSVRCWLEGETARIDRVSDPSAMATSLAALLTALQRINPADGPPPGPHSAFRGGRWRRTTTKPEARSWRWAATSRATQLRPCGTPRSPPRDTPHPSGSTATSQPGTCW